MYKYVYDLLFHCLTVPSVFSIAFPPSEKIEKITNCFVTAKGIHLKFHRRFDSEKKNGSSLPACITRVREGNPQSVMISNANR